MLKKNRGGGKIVLVTFVFFLVLFSICLTLATLNSISYRGQYYSKGFLSEGSWEIFVTTTMKLMVKWHLVATDTGDLNIVVKDSDGNQYPTNLKVNYDPKTGQVWFGFNMTLPSGEKKNILYQILFGNEKNLTKYIKVEDYYNMSIEDILFALRDKVPNIRFVGERSNITINYDPNSTDGVIVDYEKNIAENFTSPLGTMGISSTNSTNTSAGNNVTNLSSDISDSSQDSGGDRVENSPPELTVLEPSPKETIISVKVNETQKFSIENNNNETITWYLDGKVVKNNSHGYDFKSKTPGTFNVKVEIKKDFITGIFGKLTKTAQNSWTVKVSSKATAATTPKKPWIIYMVLGLVILIFLIAIYWIMSKRKIVPQTMNR